MGKKNAREFDESMILRNKGLWEAGIQGQFGSSQSGGCLAIVSIQRPRAAGWCFLPQGTCPRYVRDRTRKPFTQLCGYIVMYMPYRFSINFSPLISLPGKTKYLDRTIPTYFHLSHPFDNLCFMNLCQDQSINLFSYSSNWHLNSS